MKKNIYGLILIISIIFTSCSTTKNLSDNYRTNSYQSSISYQQFYDDLSPYGQWINNSQYGNVWSPRVTGFRPYYSNGYWAYTNYGWTWVSNYNWGWAAFHYGRWFYDDFDGWLWVPGNEWAPAWVSWRGNSQYYGWAPLCPQRNDGRYNHVRNEHWAFVPQQYINNTQINNYYITQQNNTTIINNTTELNRTRLTETKTQYPVGPRVAEVEKVTKTRITPLAIKQSSTPGSTQLQNGALHIYKPVVKQTLASPARIPVKVSDNEKSINTNTQANESSSTINQDIRNTPQQKVPVQTQAIQEMKRPNVDKDVQPGTKEMDIDRSNSGNLNPVNSQVKPISSQAINDDNKPIVQEEKISRRIPIQNLEKQNIEDRSVNTNKRQNSSDNIIRTNDKLVRNSPSKAPEPNIKPSRTIDQDSRSSRRPEQREQMRSSENRMQRQNERKATQTETRPLEEKKVNRPQSRIIK